MSDLLTFCESRIETVSLEIIETQKELDTKLENEACEEINATFRKNDEINRKHPQQGKNKTFTNYKKLQKLTTTYYLPETFKCLQKQMHKTDLLTKTWTKQTRLQKHAQNRRAYKKHVQNRRAYKKDMDKTDVLTKTYGQNRRPYKKHMHKTDVLTKNI